MVAPETTPAFHKALARRWAPVHWQEVDPSSKWRGDLLTAVDFDGNWRTIGNWDAMEHQPLVPVVYYSVVETDTHWYVVYAFYHPRDWATGIFAFLDEHENDIEGLLLIVEKPGSLADQFPFGQLIGMITLAHNHFYSYSNSLGPKFETIDGDLFQIQRDGDDVLRPCSRQEKKGHGCYGMQPTNSGEWKDLGKPVDIDDAAARLAFEFKRRSGIRYFPGEDGVEPNGYGPVTQVDVPYRLEDVFAPSGLWQRKCAPPGEPFAVVKELDKLAGEKKGKNKASPPWSWDDQDDGPTLRAGIIATNPARLALHYFDGFAVTPSTIYVRNPYARPPQCTARTRSSASRLSQPELRSRLRSDASPTLRGLPVDPLVAEMSVSKRGREGLLRAARSVLGDAVKQPRVGSRRGRARPDLEPDAAERVHRAVPAIQVLGKLGDRQSRATLAGLIESSTDRDVLLAALEALGNMAPGNVRGLKGALEEQLYSGDPRVREAATVLYAQHFARRYPRPLTRLRADPRGAVRAAALEGLGRSGRDEYKADLAAAAKDPGEAVQVRVAALRSLRSFGLDLDALDPTTSAMRRTLDALTDAPASPEDYARFCIARELAE